MTAVALIGCDGAGKTSVAKLLIEDGRMPVRYVYMGVNAQSSNVSLPTTRLVHMFKVRKVRQRQRAEGQSTKTPVSLHGLEHRRNDRGRLWAAARLVNRIAEETLRQMMSTWHQFRGYVVVYDRHFLFDYGAVRAPTRLSDRLHRAWLERVYPKPDLVLFLDAPPEVLYARKQEVPIDYLEGRRRAYLRQGEQTKGFEVLDASLPFSEVYEQVSRRIQRHIEESGTRLARVSANGRSGGRE